MKWKIPRASSFLSTHQASSPKASHSSASPESANSHIFRPSLESCFGAGSPNGIDGQHKEEADESEVASKPRHGLNGRSGAAAPADALADGSARPGEARKAEEERRRRKEEEMLRSIWGVTAEQERAMIARFRAELSAEVTLTPHFDDLALRRFLRSRNHDFPKARALVLDTLRWREREGVDAILESFDFPELSKFHAIYPEGFFGVDLDGRPVYFQRPGGINVAEILKFTTIERCMRYHLRKQEWMLTQVLPAASIVRGVRIASNTLVLDVAGMGVTSLAGDARHVIQNLLHLDQERYPELMYRAVVINAPTSFRLLWALVRPLLNARTRSKVQVLSGKPFEVLKSFMHPESIPIRYGGKCSATLLDEPGPWRDPSLIKRVQGGEDRSLPLALL